MTLQLSNDLRREIQAAMDAALGFLLRHQRQDGAWHDFETYGGSDEWVTGYIAWCIGEAARERESAAWPRAAALARDFLRSRQRPADTWGFNPEWLSDADSTAFALLGLAACGAAATPSEYAGLLAFQRDDGGFATFLPPPAPDNDPDLHPQGGLGSWGSSHGDVTCAGYLALDAAEPLDGAASARAEAFLRALVEREACVPSFWWRNDGYAYAMYARVRASRTGTTLPPPRIRSVRLSWSSPFELASLADACLHLGADAWPSAPPPLRMARVLLDDQDAEGAWRGGCGLTMPEKTDERPWATRRDRITVQDVHGLFTTATVVRFLQALLDDA